MLQSLRLTTNDRLQAYVPLCASLGTKWAESIVLGNQLAAGQIDEATYYGKIGAPLGNPKANIQMVILENNQLGTNIQTADVIEAFKSVKYIVSVTEDFTKPSSMYADILIPEAYAQFESRQPRSGNQGVSGFFAGTSCLETTETCGSICRSVWIHRARS